MIKIKEKYLFDKQGNPDRVVLNIKDYRRLKKLIEELDEIRIYDQVKSLRDKVIPFEKAVKEIERSRK